MRKKHRQPPEAHVSRLYGAKIGLRRFRVFPTEAAFRVWPEFAFGFYAITE